MITPVSSVAPGKEKGAGSSSARGRRRRQTSEVREDKLANLRYIMDELSNAESLNCWESPGKARDPLSRRRRDQEDPTLQDASITRRLLRSMRVWSKLQAHAIPDQCRNAPGEYTRTADEFEAVKTFYARPDTFNDDKTFQPESHNKTRISVH